MVYHVTAVFIALSALSLIGVPVFVGIGLWHARRAIRCDDTEAAPVDHDGELPGVSILKPVAGADEALESSLESFFAIDYPRYEIVFAARDARDPACAIIARVRARHPERASSLVFSGDATHASPKVANLAAAAARARYAVLWLSDSSTRVHRNTLASMVHALRARNVGCVASAIVGAGEETLGAAIENVHMTAFVGLGSFVAHAFTGMVGTGKSVLVRAATIAAIGGWNELGRFSGEDIVLFQRVRSMGRTVAIDRYLVCEVARRGSVRAYRERHVRWGQIRWHTVPLAAALEPLLSPMIPAGLWLATTPSWLALTALGLALIEQLACDAVILSRFRGAPPDLRCVVAIWVRPMLNLAVWLQSAVRPRIVWRGHSFRIGASSEILPVARARRARDA